MNHLEGNPGENLESISYRCYLFEIALVWELTEETIVLHLGCLQGGEDLDWCRPYITAACEEPHLNPIP